MPNWRMGWKIMFHDLSVIMYTFIIGPVAHTTAMKTSSETNQTQSETWDFTVTTHETQSPKVYPKNIYPSSHLFRMCVCAL